MLCLCLNCVFLMSNRIRPTTVCKLVHHQGFFITPRVALEVLLYFMTFHITIQGDASKMVYHMISDEMMQGNWGFTKPFSLWLRNIVSQMNTVTFLRLAEQRANNKDQLGKNFLIIIISNF